MVALNDVSEAFIGLLEEVVIDRVASGSFSDGLWADGVSSQVTIDAVVQNANPKDMMMVDEGLRDQEGIKLHTQSELRTVEEVRETNADVVNYQGHEWRIYNVADRKIGGYYKAIAIQIKAS